MDIWMSELCSRQDAQEVTKENEEIKPSKVY
jgi:hypothetical protein